MYAYGIFISCFIIFSIFCFLFASPSVRPRGNINVDLCKPSSCGNIPNISFPFRLSGDPLNCSVGGYELSCDHNQTILRLNSGKYRVDEIDYVNNKLRVVDVGILKNNCSALPLHSLPRNSNFKNGTYFYLSDRDENAAITLISCVTEAANYSAIYMTKDCFFNSTSPYNYVVDGHMLASDLQVSCSVEIHLWALQQRIKILNNTSLRSIYDGLHYGFHLHFFTQSYFSSRALERLFLSLIGFSIYITMAIVARGLVLGPFIFAFLVYKWKRRHLSMYDNIEDFIQSHNNLRPVRYSYSDIKKMTKGFKHKLGQGGYGSVFKGTLQSGHLVAVKLLNDTKANGQDFINEVATIGRIHHFNVAPLIGFCADRSKRALLYNFMPNGSLEKYIFPSEDENIFLSFEKLHAISLGIARGIEYLHRGCEMQILHFDIKPHNILLDENFTPKVSDFGLAKLYPTNDSIVNLTAVRGTMGYMAPELFYKNIGGVSYKSDVYSYGMLLMEMASKRKNSNPQVEHSSQQYFPSWVYDQFCDGNDIEMGDATDEERNIVKRMMMVAFWCIQWNPSERPSMTKVMEMLEGNDQLLMPPKLFLSMQEDHGINTDPPSEFCTSDDDWSDTISLIVNSS